MTTVEKAQQMAAEFHCRYCPWTDLGAHPAMKCRGDVEDAATEITALLNLLVEARGIVYSQKQEKDLRWFIERIDKALRRTP